MSSLCEIAKRLVAVCRAGEERTALDTLHAADAVSVEAAAMPGGMGREAAGLDAIRAKHDWWDGAMEVHSAEVDGPYLHGEDRFAVIFTVDATDRTSSERRRMRAVAVYTVADGRIRREEFYYGA